MASRKGSTIGSNPLDQVIPRRSPTPAAVEESEAVKPRERVTIALPAELMDRARNAVYWTPGATLAGLVEKAVIDEMARREKVHGGRYQPRGANLKPGRRMA